MSIRMILSAVSMKIDRIGAVCVTAYPDDNDTDDEKRDSAWLVTLLLDTWEMQQRYANECVVFDTPEFIALAERARETGQRLYQAEPALKNRKKLPQLFYDETQSPHFYAFDGRDDGLSHWMADLAAYDGTIVYLISSFDEQKEKVEIPFAEGKITAKQFAEGMDE